MGMELRRDGKALLRILLMVGRDSRTRQLGEGRIPFTDQRAVVL
jgi:hypothetical protein